MSFENTAWCKSDCVIRLGWVVRMDLLRFFIASSISFWLFRPSSDLIGYLKFSFWFGKSTLLLVWHGNLVRFAYLIQNIWDSCYLLLIGNKSSQIIKSLRFALASSQSRLERLNFILNNLEDLFGDHLQPENGLLLWINYIFVFEES